MLFVPSLWPSSAQTGLSAGRWLDENPALIGPSFVQDHVEFQDRASDYLAIDPGWLSYIQGHAARLDDFCEAFWPHNQHLPCILWQSQTSHDIAYVFNAYLRFMLMHTSGIQGNSHVMTSTLKRWATALMYLASHHLVVPGSVNMGANPAAYREILPNKADSLWNLVMETSVPLFIKEFKLRWKAKEI